MAANTVRFIGSINAVLGFEALYQVIGERP